MEVHIISDQIHILKECDDVASQVGPCAGPVVAHADGSMVSATNPAKSGEEVVVYAVGLGQTTPPLQTGKLVTTPVPTQVQFTLDFNYRPNALATQPAPNGPTPLFAGATPGFVGLYQVNFVVPPPPAGTQPCIDTSKLAAQPAYAVRSNLTVSIGGQSSFDGAGICVVVPSP
jgi:uncharacterized protein (TIGR03437 family)